MAAHCFSGSRFSNDAEVGGRHWLTVVSIREKERKRSCKRERDMGEIYVGEI